MVHRHWAPIFSIVHTASTDTGRGVCGNRHCPRCLAAKSWQWLEKQTRSLLPITYYHCVFTLPAELNSLMLANERKLYPALVRLRRTESAGDRTQPTQRRSRNHHCLTYLGRKAGLPSPSSLHCHRRSIKSGWQQWRSPKQRKFLFPVRALAALFRGKFLAGLAQMLDAGELHLPDSELKIKIAANRGRWFSSLYSEALGPSRQTSLWRATAGLKLPGQLHPPRRAEQPPYRRRRRAASERHLHLSRLPAMAHSARS